MSTVHAANLPATETRKIRRPRYSDTRAAAVAAALADFDMPTTLAAAGRIASDRRTR